MSSHRDKLLARLDEHQAKALEIIKRGDMLLARGAIANPPLLSQSRWELARVLTAYQAFKYHELFDPAIRGGAPDKVRVAEKMKAECIAISEDFRAHVTRRANLDIAADWEAYRPAVAKLLARIKAHMIRERWIVASMLLAPASERPARAA